MCKFYRFTLKMNHNTGTNQKRTDYISWHDYFMATAFLAAKRSKDPCSQVGACVVNENKCIVGIGYNGMPRKCDDDKFPWGKESSNEYDNKYFYVCHAEVNAILNKNCASVENCTLYTALFPCNECAKVIIQAGIKEIIYFSDKHAEKISTKASKRMLDAADIKYWQYIPEREEILINFNEINLNGTVSYDSMENIVENGFKSINLRETK